MLALLAACKSPPSELAGDAGTAIDAGIAIDAAAASDAGTDAATTVDAATAIDAGAPSITRILFIGNSYTSANNLPALLEGLADAENLPVHIESSTPGGARFLNHLSNAGTMAKINAGGWHHVILQNQSQYPGFRPEHVATSSLPNAEALATAIRSANPNAEVTYYATWGRRDGDAQNCNYYPLVCTFAGHTQALIDGYSMYEASTGDDIAPIGSSWKDVVDSTSAPFASAALWSGDGSHPTIRGSYLAALVLFGRIFHTPAEGTSFAAGLSQTDASFLQSIASPYARLCGNGVLDGDEACDDGGESASCNDDCTLHACGDLKTNAAAGEDCDEGGIDTASCDSDCTVASCGDGVVNTEANEVCDDQGESAACNFNCTIAACGDRVFNASANEQCDDGNLVDGDYCDQNCQLEAADLHEPDNDAASATAIVPSTTFISDHTVVGHDDIDYFSVPLVAGADYVIRTWGNGNLCSGPGVADTVLSLFGPDGTTLIAANDDNPEAQPIICSHIPFAPTQSATYFLAVESYGTGLGDYHLQVRESVNGTPATAQPVGALPASLAMADTGLAHWFSFAAAQGQSYTVNIADTNCQSADESDLFLYVYRADGTTLVVSDYEEFTETCSAVNFLAPADETMLIRIKQEGRVLIDPTYTLEVQTP
jgi:cysteine-rich repeat protein